MSRFITMDRKTAYLMPPSLEDWLNEDHLARFIVEVIDQLDLSNLTRQYAGRGSKAYHPATLLAILVYGYATGCSPAVGWAGRIGCWAATQPDRGSDGLTLYAQERHPGSQGNKGNLQARFVDDEVVFNGQTSAWVSNGPVAQVALLDIVADYGDGFFDTDGSTFGCNVIVPLDLKGVSRGKPLEKLGKRALPQGEIYFDNVRVPRRFAVATRDDYELKHAHAWAHAGTAMSHIATGLARAAFELALGYVHERRQGGAMLSAHQLTQYRLGVIGSKLEAIRAMARHVATYTRCSPRPHPYFTASGKAFACGEMMTVVNESLQLFGGVGLTRELPIEKLLRDARAMQIEDGENHLLLMHYGYLLSQLHQQEGWGRE